MQFRLGLCSSDRGHDATVLSDVFSFLSQGRQSFTLPDLRSSFAGDVFIAVMFLNLWRCFHCCDVAMWLCITDRRALTHLNLRLSEKQLTLMWSRYAPHGLCLRTRETHNFYKFYTLWQLVTGTLQYIQPSWMEVQESLAQMKLFWMDTPTWSI